MIIEFFKNLVSKSMTHSEFIETCYKLNFDSLLFCHGQKSYYDDYKMLQWSFEQEIGSKYRVNYLSSGKLQEFIKDERIAVRDKISQTDVKKLKTLYIDKNQIMIDQVINDLKSFPVLERNDIKLVKENRSHEWLTHTCEFLKNSMEQAETDDNYILKYFFFCERKPHNFVNLKIFNIEFILVFNENKLFLEVYDYGPTTDERKLKLKDEFQYIHMQVFDEILKLVVQGQKILLTKF